MHAISSDDEVTLIHISIDGSDPCVVFAPFWILLNVGDCFVDLKFGLVR